MWIAAVSRWSSAHRGAPAAHSGHAAPLAAHSGHAAMFDLVLLLLPTQGPARVQSGEPTLNPAQVAPAPILLCRPLCLLLCCCPSCLLPSPPPPLCLPLCSAFPSRLGPPPPPAPPALSMTASTYMVDGGATAVAATAPRLRRNETHADSPGDSLPLLCCY